MIKQTVIKHFQDEIPRIVEAIKQYGPRKIILFGSFVEGDVNAGSDIDLCVIKNTAARFMDRAYEAIRLVDSTFAVDALVYTEQEFDRMAKEGNSLIRWIMNKGKILYEQKP